MSDERRTRYLETALALFAEHGFAGTSMDMIVAAVGGSKATLYKYFPAKEALIAGLMDQVAHSIVSVGDALAADLPIDDALRRFGTTLLRGVTGERVVTLLRLSLGEYGRFPELARVVWDHGPGVTYARFRAFLEQRVQAGELVVADRELAAEHFMAGLVGHIQLKVAMGLAAPPNDLEIERRVDAVTELFLARYRARAAP